MRSATKRFAIGIQRTPRLPVSRAKSFASLAESSGIHTTRIRCPARPFFMIRGVIDASRAPASIKREMVSAKISPEISSTFVSRTSIVVSSAADSIRYAVKIFGWSDGSRLPAPRPRAMSFPASCGTGYDAANSERRAAPVGVQSSPSKFPMITSRDESFRISAVAGAGTGITPCEQVRVPNPTASGRTLTAFGFKERRAVHEPRTSAIASSAPTSWKWTWWD